MDYRPDGWEEIKESILEYPNGMDKFCCSNCGDEIVEATADAILEALKKEGKYVNTQEIPGMYEGNILVPRYSKGIIAFIPEV